MYFYILLNIWNYFQEVVVPLQNKCRLISEIYLFTIKILIPSPLLCTIEINHQFQSQRVEKTIYVQVWLVYQLLWKYQQVGTLCQSFKSIFLHCSTLLNIMISPRNMAISSRIFVLFGHGNSSFIINWLFLLIHMLDYLYHLSLIPRT